MKVQKLNGNTTAVCGMQSVGCVYLHALFTVSGFQLRLAAIVHIHAIMHVLSQRMPMDSRCYFLGLSLLAMIMTPDLVHGM